MEKLKKLTLFTIICGIVSLIGSFLPIKFTYIWGGGILKSTAKIILFDCLIKKVFSYNIGGISNFSPNSQI
jgi:hypothetical protein